MSERERKARGRAKRPDIARPPPQTAYGGSVGRSIRDYMRAIGGGLLFGMPLLYTQEMWEHGLLLPAWKVVAYLLVGFAAVVGYNALSGFRRERTWGELLVDAVQTIGLALIVSLVALVLLGRISTGTGLYDAATKLALETIPVSFGASIAITQLSAGGAGQEQGSPQGERVGVGALGRMFVAAGGALLLGLTVAPTFETVLLGAEVDWWLLLLTMVASYGLTYAIVFYADFRGGRLHSEGQSPLDRPNTETVGAYGISLLIAFGLVWFFGGAESSGLEPVVAQVVLLGAVCSFGAAAGRLLVGGTSPGEGSASV